MIRILGTPQRSYLPGTSVVLAADPAGPRLTVLGMDRKGGDVSYLVVWRDQSGERREAEYGADQLMLSTQPLA